MKWEKCRILESMTFFTHWFCLFLIEFVEKFSRFLWNVSLFSAINSLAHSVTLHVLIVLVVCRHNTWCLRSVSKSKLRPNLLILFKNCLSESVIKISINISKNIKKLSKVRTMSVFHTYKYSNQQRRHTLYTVGQKFKQPGKKRKFFMWPKMNF